MRRRGKDDKEERKGRPGKAPIAATAALTYRKVRDKLRCSKH
jgi:hypothetical protein